MWLTFVVAGVSNVLLELYFLCSRPGAPDLRLGLLHKIKFAEGIVFVTDRELLTNNIFQTAAGLLGFLAIVTTAMSMGIDRSESSER